MINKLMLGLSAIAIFAASPALAQTHSWEGAVFPMQFDSGGVRHWYTYGYDGPFAPPFSEPNHPAGLRGTKHGQPK